MSEYTKSNQTVSVIGLGAMGSGIARTFLDAGCRVFVWNRSHEKINALVSHGAIACGTPEDALKASTYVVVCLIDYSAWKETIEAHDLQNHFDGTCIIQLTTGTIDEVLWHTALVQEHGGRVTDGAVQCYPSQLGTADGSLLMAGDTKVLAECDPLLRMLVPTWMNLGEDITQPAALSRAVIACVVTSLVGFVNGVAIAQRAGISLDLFLQHASNVNALVIAEQTRIVDAIENGDTQTTQASIDTWAAGHQVIQSVAESLGTNLVLQDAAQAVFQEGRRMGLGGHDLSALVKVFASATET